MASMSRSSSSSRLAWSPTTAYSTSATPRATAPATASAARRTDPKGKAMNKAFGQADPALERWTYQTFAPEDELLREVRARQAAAGLPDIQVAPLDGLH